MSDRLIFISYSHKDKKWKDQLEEQLGVLEQQGSLEIWTDSDIGGGEDWYEKIVDALKNARVAVLLVSAGSLNTKFILREELSRLLRLRDKEGLRIFPIIASDCNWQEVKWLARMQVRPTDGSTLQGKNAAKRATELKNIVSEIAKIVGAAAGLRPPASSEPRLETPERPPTDSVPKPTGIEEEISLQELKAQRDRAKRESDRLNRAISERESRSSLHGSSTSDVSMGHQERPATSDAASPQTPGGFTQIPEGGVNAKKE
jgi:hypothetical protein